MTKQSGLGDNLYVAQFDLSGDAGALSRIATPRAALPVTGINKSAMERIYGRRDGALAFTTFFNDASGAAHPALSILPTTNRVLTYCRGTSAGAPAASMVAKQLGYDGEEGDDGSLSFAVEAEANGFGLEWGNLHTAGKITHASAGSETSVDGGAASSFGLQAYLHIFSLGSGTPTIKIQESSHATGSGDAFADVTGGAFSIQAVGAERIATATDLAVERYLRVTTTGTFTNLVFAVSVVRNSAVPV